MRTIMPKLFAALLLLISTVAAADIVPPPEGWPMERQ
jgi:hypothetical protein